MPKGRLLAFSDGVIAILITIMVLELHAPKHANWSALSDDLPVLLAYVLSFVNVGIYWNNHHHMLATVKHVSGGTLWANLHMLFWLSLVPFTTAWMSENDFATAPVAAYGLVLLGSALSFIVLTYVLLHNEGPHSMMARALGSDTKSRASLVMYVVGIALTFVDRWIGIALYVAVAIMWFVPDRRYERVYEEATPAETAETAEAE